MLTRLTRKNEQYRNGKHQGKSNLNGGFRVVIERWLGFRVVIARWLGCRAVIARWLGFRVVIARWLCEEVGVQ